MMSPKGRKHCRSLPFDVLVNLPDNVIDVILTHLPYKDAVRTSVLSKKWRYNWCRLIELTLDESLWETQKDLLNPTAKFTKIIYHLLTLHEGPITKFTLDIANLRSSPDIYDFIYFLPRTDIQHLVLHLPWKKLYKLPSSLFRCWQLRHLNLHNCLIIPPLAFDRFDRLVSLELCRVTVSSEFLGSLIAHCSLLEQLVLKISETSDIIEINAPMLRSFDFMGNISFICLKNVPLLAKASLISKSSSTEAGNFDYAKFFESCSALEHLLLNFGYSEFFADEVPTRLPIYLNRVKRFHLPEIMLKESYKLSCALCLLRSFPYLEYLKVEVLNVWPVYNEVDSIQESLEFENFSNVTFNHLRKVTLVSFGGTTPEMQLIKLLLAKSPVLVKMVIYPVFYLDTRSETLAELSKFRHASPTAEIDYHMEAKTE
ncbi:F-box/FBD/LRR-repeat protein At1g13570-like [Lycium ferocissimum]|uniref:F-box/FBD/LRR-repeat protein At1g13570-like n=1 Tax=Lycium ferocissimum TaxID=112874 RepID=UPI002815C91B|nr:F-box/FBD/LRR-repeat protein At1g13570-like [Lycium ferocissimum]XP_059307214.1 F-box/FBD/LRR-repeat protein At1g13570-like [Lycium ferocissimum]